MLIIIAAAGFSCKHHKGLVPQKDGRIVIKFCPRAGAADRMNFLKRFNLRPLASGVFGYDVVQWRNAPPDLKDERSPFGCPTAGSGQNIIVEDYEMENVRLKKAPSAKLNLSKNNCPPKAAVPWPERFIQTERAHRFLKEKRVPLWPNGIVFADEGMFFSHPDIAPVLKYDENKKPIFWINPERKPSQQTGYHASIVSCLAAGYRDGKGIDGVAAPGSYILPLILFFDAGAGSFYSDIAIGLAHFRNLENQGKISFHTVNMSFHMGTGSKIVNAAIRHMDDKLFIVAAGNSGSDIEEEELYPAKWKLPNVMVVAATDRDDKLADISSYSRKRVHIAAPGKDVCSCQLSDGYKIRSGTSLSTPLVSGAVSLLFSIDPFMHRESAKAALLLGAEELYDLDDKVIAGKRLNVYNSVRLLYGLRHEFNP